VHDAETGEELTNLCAEVTIRPMNKGTAVLLKVDGNGKKYPDPDDPYSLATEVAEVTEIEGLWLGR
jgi:hypothetical protein